MHWVQKHIGGQKGQKEDSSLQVKDVAWKDCFSAPGGFMLLLPSHHMLTVITTDTARPTRPAGAPAPEAYRTRRSNCMLAAGGVANALAVATALIMLLTGLGCCTGQIGYDREGLLEICRPHLHDN